MLRYGALTAWIVALPLGCGRAPPVDPPQAPRNLLLVTLDTTRADHLGAYGYSRPTSPEIDRLTAQSVVFERAYATSSWTLPSVSSLMTGQWISTHRCTKDSRSLPEDFETLAERLQGAGFATGAVVTHIYLDRRYGLAQGFGEYDQELVLETFKSSQSAVSSPAATTKALRWLEARAREPDVRWFLWLHYFDPHNAYIAHAGISEHYGDTDLDRYDGEITFTDLHVGEVLDALDRLELDDRTIVALAADHGEEFGDHGNQGHRLTLYEEVLRVPFLLRVPGIAPARVASPVSIVDLLPTALDLLDLPVGDDLAGRSLAPLMNGAAPDAERPLLAELDEKTKRVTSIVVGNWKLVRDRRTERTELFDLEADPLERTDLSGAEPERVREMTERLDRMLGSARAAGTRFRESSRVDLAPEEDEALRELGYTGTDDEDD